MKIPPGFASIEEFLDTFSGTVGGLISYVDAQNRIQYASKGLLEWFDATLEEVRGKTLAEIYGADTYGKFAAWTDRALAGEDVHYERQARKRDGTPVWLSVNLRPHRDADGKCRVKTRRFAGASFRANLLRRCARRSRFPRRRRRAAPLRRLASGIR